MKAFDDKLAKLGYYVIDGAGRRKKPPPAAEGRAIRRNKKAVPRLPASLKATQKA